MAKFSGRCFVIDDELHMLDVFASELRPMQWDRRGVDEWAEGFITDSGADWLRDALDLGEGNWQVLFVGEIWGSWSNGLDGHQYEEDCSLEVVEVAAVPDEFAEWMRSS